jgi:hypothetical protein
MDKEQCAGWCRLALKRTVIGSLLMLAALATESLPSHFLLASGTYCPSSTYCTSPVQAYIYAVFFFHPGHFTMKMEAAWTSEMLVSYDNTI